MPSLFTRSHAFLFPDLRIRSDEPELMDDPTSDPILLWRTLDHFQRINLFLSRTHVLFNRLFFKDMQRRKKSTFTLLDIGAGGGDIAIGWLKKCISQSINIKITCIDSDPRVITYARKACAPYKDIEVIEKDLLALAKEELSYDYVFANNFLHHFTTDRIPAILTQISKMAKRGFLLCDIERNGHAYCYYSILSRLIFSKSFAFHDGRLSIKKGFTKEELRHLFHSAKIDSFKVGSMFPWRLYVFGGEMIQPQSG